MATILSPQAGPQNQLLSCPVFEVFIGGGAGGGASFGMLLDWLSHSNRHGELAKGYIFRRTNDELNETLMLCKQIFGGFAKYVPHRRQWIFKNGSILKLRYLTLGDNVDKFLSLEYSWLAIDKVTDWPFEAPVTKLRAAIKNCNSSVPKRMVLTGVTGGKGHAWVKRRYIDPNPNGYEPIFDNEMCDFRVYIPCKITDNKVLKATDPGYVKRLQDRLPDWMAEAQLAGDWNLDHREGQFDDIPEFGEWLKTVTPAFQWDWKHLIAIRQKLSGIVDGSIKKLMIFMPPRHGKSNIATIRFPGWWLEKYPHKRVIIGAYNQVLANKFSRQTRKICAERISLSKERTAVEDWETEQGGGLRAVGVGGGITGQGGDLIIIDDPVKNREEANSPAYREKVWDWYTDDLSTRMEPGASIVLIMTRWHEDDLAGRILASEDGPNWTVINMPALAEVAEGDTDELGRIHGQALCPERYDEKALQAIKTVLGNSFQALYQQRPSAVEGEIWKREYWKYYKLHKGGLPMEPFMCIHSWDTALKKEQRNDPWNCTVWYLFKHGAYLRNRFNVKMESPEGKKAIKTMAAAFPPHLILIEDKNSGTTVAQELKRDTTLPILLFNPGTKDKEERANLAVPTAEAGNLYIPEDESWTQEYVDQMAAFPNATHDEDSDTTSQFVIWMNLRRRNPARIANLVHMGR